jgi:hypothetical protein
MFTPLVILLLYQELVEFSILILTSLLPILVREANKHSIALNLAD